MKKQYEGGGCFSYGTKVIKKSAMPGENENCNIEEIKVGDEVLSFNISGHYEYDEVVLIDHNLNAKV